MSQDRVPPSEPSGGGLDLPTNRLAIYSAICGFSAFAVLWVFPFGAFVLGVPAVTTAIHGRREIALSKGAQRGDTLAVVGLTAGVTSLALTVISIVLSNV